SVLWARCSGSSIPIFSSSLNIPQNRSFRSKVWYKHLDNKSGLKVIGIHGCFLLSSWYRGWVSGSSTLLNVPQIMQEYVPEEHRGVEYSLANIFSLLSYAMAIVALKPEQFGLLVIISFSMVTLACHWLHRLVSASRIPRQGRRGHDEKSN